MLGPGVVSRFSIVPVLETAEAEGGEADDDVIWPFHSLLLLIEVAEVDKAEVVGPLLWLAVLLVLSFRSPKLSLELKKKNLNQ